MSLASHNKIHESTIVWTVEEFADRSNEPGKLAQTQLQIHMNAGVAPVILSHRNVSRTWT